MPTNPGITSGSASTPGAGTQVVGLGPNVGSTSSYSWP
tara:strand:- start:889 stop:1002 length:114 start_codon:yes stop_codon:yes gene_type:complete